MTDPACIPDRSPAADVAGAANSPNGSDAPVAGDAVPRCRCGSGAHPRECELHPEAYPFHVARLNLDSYLEESEDAGRAADEYELAFHAWRDEFARGIRAEATAAATERAAKICDVLAEAADSARNVYRGGEDYREAARRIRSGTE